MMNSLIRTLKARLEELENTGGTVSLQQEPQLEPQLGTNIDSADAEPLQTQRHSVELDQIDYVCSDRIRYPCMQSEHNNVENNEACSASYTAAKSPNVVTQGANATTTRDNGLDFSENVPHNSSEGANLNELLKPLEVVTREHAPGAPSSKDSPITMASRSPVKAACSCNRSLDSLSFNLPLRRQADDLLWLYFHRHNRMFPILHQETFMRRYMWLWQPRQDVKAHSEVECLGFCRNEGDLKLFLTLLNIVFALASLLVPGEPEQNVIKADNYFANTWMIGLHELLDYDFGFKPIQIGLLMTLYLHSTEKFSKCWNVLGLTISMARNKGIDCDNNTARNFDFDTQYPYHLMQEMRARLWCTCILLDT